ncbi:hypothetical protein ROHU_017347 [Labeo rohita]|uniref:Uncharacterized protein n=1 Tax=Labeo rohita TaxID=84645 RepID=A0A498NGH3_LABRO|nr:hypothetical protein ROHU_017347 [Labeo rohita]
MENVLAPLHAWTHSTPSAASTARNLANLRHNFKDNNLQMFCRKVLENVLDSVSVISKDYQSQRSPFSAELQFSRERKHLYPNQSRIQTSS